MRFLVDECTGAAVTKFLRNRGFDVTDAQETGPGTDDVDWLSFAVAENRVLITDDKDFGEAVIPRSLATLWNRFAACRD